MKKLLATLAHYYRQHFHWGAWVGVTLFAAMLIGVNEHFHIYERYIEHEPDVCKQLGRYLLMYGLAYGGAVLIESLARRSFAPVVSIRFWIVAAVAILVFTLRGLEQPYLSLVAHHAPILQNVFFKLWYNGGGLLWIMVPAFLYWWWSGDRLRQPFYGFHAKGVSFVPYWILVAIMVPIIFWASRDASFHSMYPRYQFLNLSPQTPHYKSYTALYESFYALDFAVTEFFFRGFLILALGRWVGPRAILPMCVFYVTIHFGKPMAEIISSYFGGLLLGVIAWETKSIYGGIIVHLGIALLMEIFGLIG